MATADQLSVLNSILTVMAIIAAPIVALQLGATFQRRADAEKAKRDLFSTILEIRHDLLSIDFVRSLNTIDVVFVDDTDVREAWSRYYSVLNDANLNNPAGWSIRDEKRRDLLLAMAKAMGWRERISTADILRTYTPQFAGEQALVNVMERQIKLSTYATELRRLGLPHPITGFQVPPTGTPTALPGTPPPAVQAAGGVAADVSEEGFYIANYIGHAGGGSATLLLNAHTISGFDTLGGTYDGSYRKEADQSLTVSVTVTIPAGVGLATGVPAQAGPQSFPIMGRLPANFANGNPVTIDVRGQPVQVAFTKVRGLPQPQRN